MKRKRSAPELMTPHPPEDAPTYTLSDFYTVMHEAESEPHAIKARLDYIEESLRNGAVPDSEFPYGKRKFLYPEAGGKGREGIPWPNGKEQWRDELRAAVGQCRQFLEDQDFNAAKEKLSAINDMVVSIGQWADPDRRRGYETRESASRGGKARAAQKASDQAALASEIRSDIDEIRARNNQMSRTAARRQVSQRRGMSLRTIGRLDRLAAKSGSGARHMT